MAKDEDILTAFLTGQNPLPGSGSVDSIAAMQTPQPKAPGFFKQMLAGMLTGLSGDLQSGAFTSAVGRGISRGTERGGTPGAAFGEAFGAVPEERQKIEATNVMRRIQEMRAKAEQEDMRLKQERMGLDREREARIAAMQQENLKATLAKAGLRQAVDPATGEVSYEPTPELENRRKLEQEYKATRLEIERIRMELSRERNQTMRDNYQRSLGELEVKRRRQEAEYLGTVDGVPLAGGPTDAGGQPMGLGVFRATKPTLAEGQAAASIVTSKGTVDTLKATVIPNLRKAIEEGNIESFIVEQRALRQQLGLLANISRGIGGERGAQTEQDIQRAQALLPTTIDVLKDFATAGRTTQRVLQEIEAIVQRNTDILSRVPGVNRILRQGKTPAPAPKSTVRFTPDA